MATQRWTITAVLAATLTLVAYCGGGTGSESGSSVGGSGSTPAETGGAAGTPVRVGHVLRDTLRILVTASGRTEVLEEETVRAPFAGTLTRLDVIDGDQVTSGEALASMISRSSEATLEGAQAMLRSARTAADSADAREALQLARRNLVERVLEAPSAGVVLSHAASPGDRLSEGDEILRVAAAGSAVFVAEVPQNELTLIRTGQPAWIRLAAMTDTLAGTVHGILPAASSSTFSAPVRIDFHRGLKTPAVGLFGTAIIVVGQRAGILSVPVAAVLTDDITGVSRVAVVRDGRVAWVTVQTGITDRGRIEISGPGIAAGDAVIVSGQVGLPDGAAVRIRS